MTTIIEFITARLDEIEEVARAAGNGQWSVYLEGGDDGWAIEDVDTPERGAIIGDKAMADHIALNDPAYVLTDIAAKRRIVHLYAVVVDDYNPYDAYEFADGRTAGLHEVMVELASVWSGHPDYDERWRP